MNSVRQSRSQIRNPKLELLENLGRAADLLSDAQMAALAIDHDAVPHTADTVAFSVRLSSHAALLEMPPFKSLYQGCAG